MEKYDVIVIGGGQSGLAVGYYLRRSGLSYLTLDNETEGGGAWQHAWTSLRLFSPAQWSSLPGMLMEGGSHYYPARDEAISYLRSYEKKYAIPVKRNVRVANVRKEGAEFHLETSAGPYVSRAVVSATGSFANPFIPDIPGIDTFEGEVIHSCQYRSPASFRNKRIAVVGEGNSGAQILAEVSRVTTTIWITLKEPRFLPDHVDGRFLFDAATQMYEAQKAGKPFTPPSLGDIVMVDSVRDARDRKVLSSVRPFHHFTSDSLVWEDGRKEKVDAVIFCTGFKPVLAHLRGLGIDINDGRPETIGTRSAKISGLWLVGYGNWTGFASATLIGVGRSARQTVAEIRTFLGRTENFHRVPDG